MLNCATFQNRLQIISIFLSFFGLATLRLRYKFEHALEIKAQIRKKVLRLHHAALLQYTDVPNGCRHQ